MMSAPRVGNIVADAVVFMKNIQVQEFSENIFTILEVASEIKDADTKRRLAVLPYELKFKEPNQEALKIVTEFSKKTGDYPSLSAVDMKVMALTYQLEKQFVGTDHIKETPCPNVTITTSTKNLERQTQIAGFYLPKGNLEENCKDEITTSLHEVTLDENEHSKVPETSSDEANLDLDPVPLETSESQPNQQNSDIEEEGIEIEEEDFEDTSSNDGSLDDDSGWITPNNISKIRSEMSVTDDHMDCTDVEVACITSDFAMQNVLIQMGLNVLSVNGMLIKQAKTYVLRCHACMKTTKEMDRMFCHWCGNKTLNKIAYTLNKDGTVSYHHSRLKPISTRGLRHSIPTPKGGKHSQNEILCEDQYGHRAQMSKLSRNKTDVLSPCYEARSSPFAHRDVYSKAFNLGIKSTKSDNWRSRRNPNETGRKTGNKKHKSVY